MKKIALLSLMLGLPGLAYAEPQSWAFVQSVGGAPVGAPVVTANGWVLPVHVNVSGLETISAKPAMFNSALVCKRVSAAPEAGGIYITVVTGLSTKNGNPRCPPALLGSISPGEYSVFYRGPGEKPIALGHVSIGR